MRPEIRGGHPGDADALTRIAVAAKSHWGYSPEWMRLWQGELTIAPDYLQAHRIFVAVDGERPIGMCALERRADHTALENVWIDPGEQRRGVGRALVLRALEEAGRAGLTTIRVLSDPFAEAFYLRLGARRVATVPTPMPGVPLRTLPLLEFSLPPTAPEADALALDGAVDADVPVAVAWAHRTSVANWSDPPATFSLDGPFVTGASGTTHLPGADPIRWTITDVQPGQSFALEIPVEGAALSFVWEFHGLGQDRTRLVQRIRLAGPNAAAYVEQVRAGFGATLADGMRRIAADLEAWRGLPST